MSTPLKKERALHRQAMSFADQAMLARLRGDADAARGFTEES